MRHGAESLRVKLDSPSREAASSRVTLDALRHQIEPRCPSVDRGNPWFQSSLPVAGERVRSRPSPGTASDSGWLSANLDENGVLLSQLNDSTTPFP